MVHLAPFPPLVNSCELEITSADEPPRASQEMLICVKAQLSLTAGKRRKGVLKCLLKVRGVTCARPSPWGALL